MAFIKNCYHCSNRQPEWYHDDLCKSKKVAEFKPDIFGNICEPYRPKCKEVYVNEEEDCPYFERSFMSRVAEWKSKMCAKIFALKMYLNSQHDKGLN